MVDSIGANDSLYGAVGIGAYSIGTYSQVEKTDTEVFEDVQNSRTNNFKNR